VRRPHPAAAHFFLQRVDDLAAVLVERREREPGPHEVERLDLLAHERVDPVQLLLELGVGLEVPSHVAAPCSFSGAAFRAALGVGQNRILMSQNAILGPARQALAKREAQYAREVRRLLDAALELMREAGTASSPRVADIVAAAGLSNDAFYRHFPSKEALVVALIEDGAVRLQSYLAHQMAKASTPEDRVRRWVEGVMAQAADDDIAATTRAVLWNGGRITDSLGSDRPSHAAMLATLLRDPFAELGSTDPDADALLAAHATVGVMSDLLGQRVRPARADIDHVVTFCLNAVTTKPARKRR
jgi:AcrR family transcriptional regulator